MGLADQQAKLARASKDLKIAWERTREQWRDGQARAFEEQVIEELIASARAAAEAMSRLEEETRKAEAACRDDG